MANHSDVIVVGMVMGSHVLEDIGVVVPHMVAVTIPATKALQSKDLWRAIGQKQIFRLHVGPKSVQAAAASPPLNPELSLLEERNRLLAEENKALRASMEAQTASLVQMMAEQSSRMDQRLAALLEAMTQGQMPRGVVPNTMSARATSTDVVEIEAPAFIPAEIKPKDAEARIETKKVEVGTGADLSKAASRLRALRKSESEGQ